MIKFYYLAIILLTTISIASAQFENGDIEIALNGSMGYYRKNSEGQKYTPEQESYFILSSLLDFYFYNGLSFEPEIDVLAFRGKKPTLQFLGNISYTYKPSSLKLGVFGRIGYGIANAPTLSGLNRTPSLFKTSAVSVLNFGCGLKPLLNDNVALRIELNCKWLFYSQEDYNYWYYKIETKRYNETFIGILLGFTVIL